MPKNNTLSEHDRAVLSAIFNPSEIGGDISQLVEDEFAADVLPDELQDPSSNDETSAESTGELAESQRLETAAVQHSERAEFEQALALFGEALLLTPERASLFNNRAQTYRLLKNDEAAMADLKTALRLSNSAGRTGCRALCQRGLLWRHSGDPEAARKDFAQAARLGSKFARSQLIELNPYAALCNQMLHQAFQQLS